MKIATFLKHVGFYNRHLASTCTTSKYYLLQFKQTIRSIIILRQMPTGLRFFFRHFQRHYRHILVITVVFMLCLSYSHAHIYICSNTLNYSIIKLLHVHCAMHTQLNLVYHYVAGVCVKPRAQKSCWKSQSVD